MAEIPMIISVDDHVVEPAHTWQSRLPEKYREVGPRIVRRGIAGMTYLGSGQKYQIDWDDDAPPADCWVYEDLVVPHKRHVAAVGYSRDEMTLSPITYDEMRPGCYEPEARADDMLMNNVDGSLPFPTFPRFCGQTFKEAADKDLALLCVQAYNDFMVDEWCADSKGVNIPLCIIPLWDVDLAVAEVQRNAARGVHAVAFSEIPAKLDLPSIHTGYWDPFFAVCAETATAVCMHIGSSSQMPITSQDAPASVQITLAFGNAMASMTDFLFSGVLVKYPTLRLAYSEGQIGWIPYILERADDVWEEHRAWGGVAEAIPEPPSSYYYRQMYGCFFRDKHGVDSLSIVGEDNITFETDYPHTDSTWPNTKEVGEKLMGHLPQDIVYKLCRGNAITMLSLDRE
ncbi:MAG TPA: amidohydrolase family protein [Acidimicrobiia bacterium]|nr:amidohydrolase family protein [Acidimicrobiia bacterium]